MSRKLYRHEKLETVKTSVLLDLRDFSYVQLKQRIVHMCHSLRGSEIPCYSLLPCPTYHSKRSQSIFCNLHSPPDMEERFELSTNRYDSHASKNPH